MIVGFLFFLGSDISFPATFWCGYLGECKLTTATAALKPKGLHVCAESAAVGDATFACGAT